MAATTASREHDVVVFGASGFVGKLTAAYLAKHAPAGTRIAETVSFDSRVGSDPETDTPDPAGP